MVRLEPKGPRRRIPVDRALGSERAYVPATPPPVVATHDRREWLLHRARRDVESWVRDLDHLELDLRAVRRYAPSAEPTFLAVISRLEQELLACAEYIVVELDPRFRVRGDDLAAGLARFERTGAPEIEARTPRPKIELGEDPGSGAAHLHFVPWVPSIFAGRIEDAAGRRDAELYAAKRDGRDLLRALGRFEGTLRVAESRAPELEPLVRALIGHLEAQLTSCERFIRSRAGDETFRINVLGR